MRPHKQIRLGPDRPYDVIVCGAGHAGVEAALAAAQALQPAAHASPADAAGRFTVLETVWAARGGIPFPASLDAFRKTLARTTATAQTPGLKACQEALSREIDALRSEIQMPPVVLPFNQQQARKSRAQALG